MPPRANPEDKRTDLHRAKAGVAVLAVCIVETINETDPSFRDRFLEKMGEAYHKLRDDTEGDQIEQLEMLSWTRSLLTGFDFVSGKGEPFFER
tara:strand:- start:3566 stop:3844 length:279 start_codon:yes stop_codon:yes gene_type:complete